MDWLLHIDADEIFHLPVKDGTAPEHFSRLDQLGLNQGRSCQRTVFRDSERTHRHALARLYLPTPTSMDQWIESQFALLVICKNYHIYALTLIVCNWHRFPFPLRTSH